MKKLSISAIVFLSAFSINYAVAQTDSASNSHPVNKSGLKPKETPVQGVESNTGTVEPGKTSGSQNTSGELKAGVSNGTGYTGTGVGSRGEGTTGGGGQRTGANGITGAGTGSIDSAGIKPAKGKRSK